MSPVTSRNQRSAWRYYVSAKVQQGLSIGLPADDLKPVGAVAVEEAVATALRDLIGDPTASWPELRDLISRVAVYTDRVALGLTIEARARAVREIPPLAVVGSTTLVVPAMLQKRAGRVWMEPGVLSVKR